MLARSDTSLPRDTRLLSGADRKCSLTRQLMIRDGKIICHRAPVRDTGPRLAVEADYYCPGHGRDVTEEVRIIILIDFAFCVGPGVIVGVVWVLSSAGATLNPGARKREILAIILLTENCNS